MLADEDSIREVIPFPKNQSAQDLMMSAPTQVQPDQLSDLHISDGARYSGRVTGPLPARAR